MTVLYLNLCYNKVCKRGISLLLLRSGILKVSWINNWGGVGYVKNNNIQFNNKLLHRDGSFSLTALTKLSN